MIESEGKWVARRLVGKVALVTGGATGLGKAIAQRFKAEGASVVITDVQTSLGAEAAAENGFAFIEQDVADENRWPAVIGEIQRQFGSLQILVNNAGILGPMDHADPENAQLSMWRTIFSVNVEGVFLGCRAAISAMRARRVPGSIINMSSVAGLLASPHAFAYGASKAAVRHLTKSVAQYCAQEKLGIRCNSVHPGNIRTSLWDRHAQQTAELEGVPMERIVEEARAIIPLGDFTLPEDVAATVAFLASEDARHVTGGMFVVDGGIVDCDTFSMGRPLTAEIHKSTPSNLR